MSKARNNHQTKGPIVLTNTVSTSIKFIKEKKIENHREGEDLKFKPPLAEPHPRDPQILSKPLLNTTKNHPNQRSFPYHEPLPSCTSNRW